MNKNSVFDVVVIGGGPAGMMAGGSAAEKGAEVLLLEKNADLGRKLLLTGKGRSNLTRAEFSSREMVRKYGKEGDFLLHPFSVFGPKETIDFFEKRGLGVKVERGKRIFPKSDSAQDVLKILIDYLKEGRVKISTKAEVREVIAEGNRISKVILKDGREVFAKNYIICTGGKSYPVTGSTGDGYKWLEKLGHSVTKLRPALVPLKIKESWPKAA